MDELRELVIVGCWLMHCHGGVTTSDLTFTSRLIVTCYVVWLEKWRCYQPALSKIRNRISGVGTMPSNRRARWFFALLKEVGVNLSRPVSLSVKQRWHAGGKLTFAKRL